MKTDGDRIPTNMRMLMVLETLVDGEDGMTTSQIASRLGLPRQTVHRLCTTLVEERYLIAETGKGHFRPGRRARAMASTILHASTTHIVRHQVLMDIAAKTGETVNFVVPEKQGMSYEDRVETNWMFRIQLPVGTHVPFHCTASGKVFLASLRKAERDRLVNIMRMDKLTGNTLTTPESLNSELKRVAKLGYAIDNEEFVEGMIATAVPVRDPNGKYFASLAVHGPVIRVSKPDAEAFAPLLHEGARRIEEALF